MVSSIKSTYLNKVLFTLLTDLPGIGDGDCGKTLQAEKIKQKRHQHTRKGKQEGKAIECGEKGKEGEKKKWRQGRGGSGKGYTGKGVGRKNSGA
jgi:hypothetical protein